MTIENPHCDASQCQENKEQINPHIIGKRGNVDSNERRYYQEGCCYRNANQGRKNFAVYTFHELVHFPFIFCLVSLDSIASGTHRLITHAVPQLEVT